MGVKKNYFNHLRKCECPLGACSSSLGTGRVREPTGGLGKGKVGVLELGGWKGWEKGERQGVRPDTQERMEM